MLEDLSLIHIYAEPGSVFRLLEVQYIIVGLNRFQPEDLDQRPRFFAEVEACLNHLRVVEYHQDVYKRQSPYSK